MSISKYASSGQTQVSNPTHYSKCWSLPFRKKYVFQEHNSFSTNRQEIHTNCTYYTGHVNSYLFILYNIVRLKSLNIYNPLPKMSLWRLLSTCFQQTKFDSWSNSEYFWAVCRLEPYHILGYSIFSNQISKIKITMVKCRFFCTLREYVLSHE